MSARLHDEMRNLMRRRHYCIHTETAYRNWVKRNVRFHNMQSRDDLHHGEEKIEAFLTYLARDRQVPTSAQNQAMNALVFLYKHVLEQPLSGEINADRARKQSRIPVVLTREETARVIALRIGDGNTSSLPAIGPLTRAPAKHTATISTPAPSTKPLPRPSIRREPAQLCHASPATGHGHSHHPGLLGHADVSTTMIYTHALRHGGHGVMSPLDDLAIGC